MEVRSSQRHYYCFKIFIGINNKNVLKRRKECGTYLAPTAHRHRWRVKMTMKNEKCSFQPALQPSSTADEGRIFHSSSSCLLSSDVYGQQPGRCRTLSFFLTHFYYFTFPGFPFILISLLTHSLLSVGWTFKGPVQQV